MATEFSSTWSPSARSCLDGLMDACTQSFDVDTILKIMQPKVGLALLHCTVLSGSPQIYVMIFMLYEPRNPIQIG